MQLLIWTGTGEPHISRAQISIINNHYQSIGCEDQIGFDCQVSLSHYNIIFTIIVSNVLLPPLPPPYHLLIFLLPHTHVGGGI